MCQKTEDFSGKISSKCVIVQNRDKSRENGINSIS